MHHDQCRSSAGEDPAADQCVARSPDPHCAIGPDGRLVLVNAAFQRVLGWASGELLGTRLLELVHPDDREAAREPLGRLGIDPEPDVVEHRFRCRDGSHRWLALRASPPDERGVVHVAARDVTAARDALARLQRRALVFDTVSEGVLLMELDGRIVGWNAAAERIFGYTEAEALGRTPEFFHDPALGGALEAEINTSVLRDGRWAGEIPVRRKDGSPAIVEAVVVVQRDAAGRPTGLVGVNRDVTERKRAEAALRESEERYRLATRATDDIVYEWDVRTDTLYWSDALASVLGHAPADVVPGNDWWDAQIHPEDREAIVADLRATLDSTADLWRAEYRMRRADGSYAHVLERGYIVRGARGEPVRMIGAISDQSRRRELEEQLRQSQKMEAVGQLAGGVAHDFNNLLTVVKLHAELLAEELDPHDPRREDVEQIREAAERAATLTRKLLAFSRKQLLQPRVLDLNEVVAGVEPMLRRLIGEDIEVEIRLDPDLELVLADLGQLEQVIVNLALNARDAMPDGGVLRVETANATLDRAPDGRRATPAGSFVALTVADTGVGMSREVRERAFEPFFTTKPPGKGTGLGLSLVYGVAEQSGGHVSLESAPGEGSRITLFLPRLSESPMPAEARGAPAASAASRGTEAVLVVEDEDGVRRLARRILERQGYRVFEARCGREALAIARERGGEIQLLLTDLVMPDMSGRALAEHLVAGRPGLRVLYMSGYTDDEIVRRGLLGARTRFLQKPFEADVLSRAVREALDGVEPPPS